jgi:AcrR family transcriptional regulator
MGATDRSSSVKRGGRDAAKSRAAPLAPIYEQLPPGPHRLDRREVLLHQRARIQGAMVEAVIRHGYSEANVKQVVELAGVSRRSFYEQFANKEQCFLATFDLIAVRGIQRIRRAYLSAEGDLEERLAAAFAELAAAVEADRKAAVFVTTEAQRAGRAGVARVRAATAACERLLASSFLESADAAALPKPIVRAMAGGMHGVLARALDGGEVEQARLADELLRWTLHFRAIDGERLAAHLAASAVARLGSTATSPPAKPSGLAGASESAQRARLLHSALRLAVLGDYLELSAPQIADEADVPIEVFFGLFADRDECFGAAFAMLGARLLEITADSDLAGPGWPRAVRRALGELLAHLAANPLYARTIGQGAFTAGPVAAARNLELAHAIAVLLTAGAPAGPERRFTVAAIAGAIWHTIASQVASGRIQLLPMVSDHLTYVVLAPFIGAPAAAEIVLEGPR